MNKPISNFMRGLIDYAGLFPPAKLDMQPAISNYVKYLKQPGNYMLGRFICPAGRLAELEQHAAIFSGLPQLKIAVLGSSGKDKNEFIHNLFKDFEKLESFKNSFGNKVNAGVYETKLPPDIIDQADADETEDLIGEVCEIIECHIDETITPFFEADFGGDWQKNIPEIVAGIKKHNTNYKNLTDCQKSGYKLRCGGVTADAFPEVEKVALVIQSCVQHGVYFKATAGLHHPIRHYDKNLDTPMHGFLNLFGAALLAYNQETAQQYITDILADENPGNFLFDDLTFRWKNIQISADQIQAGRANIGISYGSCSFDEPREDLMQLGYLENF